MAVWVEKETNYDVINSLLVYLRLGELILYYTSTYNIQGKKKYM